MAASLRYEYLVYGYTREMESKFRLYMNIDEGIIDIIYQFYPQLLRFDYYNKEKFDVSSDGLIVKGTQIVKCSAYIVYAESPKGQGFNRGIHYWSVKNIMPVKEDERITATNDGYCLHRNNN